MFLGDEDNPSAILVEYRKAFEAADDDQDGLIQLEGLKKFC